MGSGLSFIFRPPGKKSREREAHELKHGRLLLQEASPKSPPLLQLQMAVASFCDRPFQLPLQQETRAEKDKRRPLLEDLQRDPRLRLSFGLHPECVSPLIFRVTEEAERLKKLLSLPNTVAFGGVGLDYTEPEADWQEQRLFLEQLLGLMKGSLDRIPVMVHCRENNIHPQAECSG